jgi:hypothetical protein
MPGELWNMKQVVLDSVHLMPQKELEKWGNTDWSWCDKWLPKIKDVVEYYREETGLND